MAANYGAKGFKELLAESKEMLKVMDVAFKIKERIKDLEKRDTHYAHDRIDELEWVLKLLGSNNKDDN